MTLSIRLLGQFELRRGSEACVPLASARAETLLAFLLLHRGRALPRQHVAFVLWPDSTEAQALTNLRHVLHTVRQALAEFDRHVEVTPRSLRWREDLPYRLDVRSFEDAVARGSWREAVDSYAGDLLTSRTDEWVLQERERLRRSYLNALERLVAVRQVQGDLAGAIGAAERWLREEPLQEGTYLTLMRLHDARGERARAVRVYHECAAALERELGVEPAAATRAEYDALVARSDELEPVGTRLTGPPFVARATEQAALTAAWRRAQAGQVQFVLLAGEPGIGKTRLAEEFRAWCAHRGATTAVARGYAGEGALAYGPIMEWLRAEELTPYLRALPRPHLTEVARLLPELLTAVPGLARPQRLPESEQRQRLYDAVARVFVAAGDPILLVADDVHWWDRESLQLLQYLVLTRRAARTNTLLVATARLEDVETTPLLNDLLLALRAAGTLTELELDGLDRAQTALLAAQLEGHERTDSEIRALHEQTAGNPLFVVETLRAGWRQGTPGLPPRVQAVIRARLAQLSEISLALVDVAATLGREFTVEVLSLAAELDEARVVRGLDELWRRRIVTEHEPVAYAFSHETIRDVAYAALTPVRRRYLHGRVAQALRDAYPHDLDRLSGQLARHLDAAGAVEQAVAAYARAAEVAQQVYANSEAVRLLSRALQLLASSPATDQRAALELHLTTSLLAPLVATEGYASRRIHQTHERALAVARSRAAEPSPPLLRSLGLGSLARGDFPAARHYGTALRERGDQLDDDVLRVEGEYVLGVTAFWAGELTDARAHLQRAVAWYRDENRQEHLLHYAQDPQVICLTRLALTHWFLGDPDAAIRARDEGLARAEELGHPYTRTVALLFASLLALDMHDRAALRRLVSRARSTMSEGGAFQTHGAVAALSAYLDLVEGRSPEGIATIQRIVAESPPVDQAAPGMRSTLLRILLAACEATGDARTGLTAADELVALTSSVVWRPEAQRLRAAFLAAQHRANA